MKKIFFFIVFCSALKLQAQNPGDNIFNTDQLIHEVRITFPINTWYDTLTHFYTISGDSNIYLMATSVEFDGTIYDSVGCRFKGNSSYNNPSQKKSWKLDFEEFKEDNEIDNMKKLNLNNGFKDPTLLREKLCLDFLNFYNIPAPRCNYANVYVNGSLWGFYTLVEDVDKTFCKTRFGNKDGNLFKGDPHGDLQWRGAAASQYYTEYELKTNETANDWSDLIWLIDNINNSSPADFHDSLDVSFNTSSYIKSWASTILFSNLDSYTGSGHNYYVYHNVDSNRFEWINWDVNEAYGTFLNGNQLTGMSTLPLNYVPAQGNRPLNTKMLADTVYWNGFQEFLCQVTDEYFNSAYMNPIIDSLYNRIKTSYYNDPKKMFPSNQFDANINSTQSNALGLKPFIQERYDYIIQQLAGLNCAPVASSVNELSKEKFNVYPNPALAGAFELEVGPSFVGREFSLSDLYGRILHKSTITNQKTKVNVEQLQAGTYIVRIGNGTKRLLVNAQ